MTDDEVRRWNSRAKYLQSISEETKQKILDRHTVLVEGTGPHPPMADSEAAMDLAVHQQRLVDWITAHPRKTREEKRKAKVDALLAQIESLPPEELAKLAKLVEEVYSED